LRERGGVEGGGEAVADGAITKDELAMEPGGKVRGAKKGGVEAGDGDRGGGEARHQPGTEL